MANNRMRIVCITCGDYISIAKYYPSTGWFTYDVRYESVSKRMDEFFDMHDHICEQTSSPMWGRNYRFEYEIQEVEWRGSKDG